MYLNNSSLSLSMFLKRKTHCPLYFLESVPVISVSSFSSSFGISNPDLVDINLDAIVFVFLCYLMYRENTSVQGFVIVMLLVAFAFNFVYTQILNPHKWQTYKFYLKHKNHRVEIKSYNLDAKTMFSLLYS